MSYALTIKNIFSDFSGQAFSFIKSDENLNINLTGEETLFVRFNQGKVRQNTEIQQCKVSFTLTTQNRKQNFAFQLTQDEQYNLDQFQQQLIQARTLITQTPEDHYQIPMQNNGKSEHHYEGRLPEVHQLLKDVEAAVHGLDFVGLYAGGECLRANANSAGQFHRFSNQTFFLDYSLYSGDRAAKSLYAGSSWKLEEFKKDLAHAHDHLTLLRKDKVKIKPGKYKVYLAPGALGEILNMLSWGGVSTQALNTGGCALKKLVQGEVKLSPQFTLRENFELGFCPQFNELGEVSPTTVDLIEKGQHKQLLTSSRSAKEFFTASNAASEGEMLRSPEILPGHLQENDILNKLDQGLYIANLHYLNWSDRQSARFTGMTRYACFWVEKGQIIGPIEDMRFDESLFHIFGDGLLELTEVAKVEPEVGTYFYRAVGGKKAPGALVADFTFTL